MNPVRGGGSASALTMTSWSALATTTRSSRPSGGGVVVVGGAAQHRRALGDPDDPGQRAGRAGGVADQGDPVADHDGLAAQLAGAHRGDLGWIVRPHARSCTGRGRRRSRSRRRRRRAWAGCGCGDATDGPVAGPGRRPRRTPASCPAAPQLLVDPLCTRSCPESGKLGQGLRGTRYVVELRRPGPPGRSPPRRAPSGGRRRSRKSGPRSGPGVISRPSGCSVTRGAERGELGGQRGQPVGLVGADVPDAAQVATASRPARPARPAPGSARPPRTGRRRSPCIAPVPRHGQAVGVEGHRAAHRGSSSPQPADRLPAACAASRPG